MSCVQGLGFVEPQLPTIVDQPPDGADWIHEIKHDGYRTILVLDRDGARAFTPALIGATVWSIARAAKRLPCKSAIIDGVCACDI
jgi:ATP-dependent DNA ligase